jgi:hypothetical protein
VRENTKWELMNNFFLIIHRKIKTYNNLKKMKNLIINKGEAETFSYTKINNPNKLQS